LPVLALSLTTELVYRFLPGRLEPHGWSSVPGNGPALPTPKYMLPWSSNEGAYQRPPPRLVSTFFLDHVCVGAVSNDQTFLPVAASSAQRMPFVPPP
jgi:hypothetical protein